MPSTDKKTQFQLAMLDYGISEEASELAWQQDSWTEATKVLRFSGKHCFTLTEINCLLRSALGLLKNEGGSWDDIAKAWHGRKG